MIEFPQNLCNQFLKSIDILLINNQNRKILMDVNLKHFIKTGNR